jgi:stringent starvation protein B
MFQSSLDSSSTRPYLIRALHEWCSDNGFTPFLVVRVDGSVQVPMEFVQNGEIVLNVAYDATNKLQLGNEYIEFQARFGGKPREIMVPIQAVAAIYARENGQGMAFPVPEKTSSDANAAPIAPAPAPAPAPASAPNKRQTSARASIQLAPRPVVDDAAASSDEVSVSAHSPDDVKPTKPKSGRPTLVRIK